MTSTHRKVLASLIAVSGLGLIAGYGIFGAFSAQTVNSGNEFSSATLELTSSNAVNAEPVYLKTNAVPGDSGNTPNSCIEITYVGTVQPRCGCLVELTRLAPAFLHTFLLG